MKFKLRLELRLRLIFAFIFKFMVRVIFKIGGHVVNAQVRVHSQDLVQDQVVVQTFSG